jgi:hypothetical protein
MHFQPKKMARIYCMPFPVAAVAQPSVGAWTGSECVEIIELFYPQTLTTLSDYSEPFWIDASMRLI